MLLTELPPKNVSLSSSKTELHPNRTLKSSNYTLIKTKNPPKWRILSPCSIKVSIKMADNPVGNKGRMVGCRAIFQLVFTNNGVKPVELAGFFNDSVLTHVLDVVPSPMTQRSIRQRLAYA
jgi:hypothetical protein